MRTSLNLDMMKVMLILAMDRRVSSVNLCSACGWFLSGSLSSHYKDDDGDYKDDNDSNYNEN